MSIKLTVYSKDDCHLCDDLLKVVERVRQDERFELEVIDINTDAALVAKYGHEIPVLLINGQRAAKFRVTEAELRKKLKTERYTAPRSRAAAPEGTSGSAVRPHRALRALLIVAALAGFGGFVARGVQHIQGGEQRLAARLLDIRDRDQSPVPFKLETLDGKQVSLNDYPGKVVFINFWATWCPPCVEEMPSMLRLYEKFKSNPNFVMLAISADDGWEPVKKFFSMARPSFTVALDPRGEIARQYGTTRFPESYVVVDGRVRAFIEGPRDWDTWFAESYLQAVLREGPVSVQEGLALSASR